MNEKLPIAKYFDSEERDTVECADNFAYPSVVLIFKEAPSSIVRLGIDSNDWPNTGQVE